MVKMASIIMGLSLSLLSAAFPTIATLEQRDVDPADSLTYCSPLDKGDEQYYIPCTKTSDPISEVQFEMPYLVNSTFNDGHFSAHFECYVGTAIGDRYLAGHPASGQNPCWVTASLLGPLDSCPSPVPAGDTCGCDKAQLASCCAFRAAGQDLNGFLNETYLYCP